MDKDDMKRLADNPDFICGIYNYCDRWCERCTMTSRCMNYALSEEQFPDRENRDINNVAFWQGLTEMLQISVEMVREAAEKWGIDLDSLDTRISQKDGKAIKEAAENHEITYRAKTYIEQVDAWMDSAQGLFKDKEEGLNLKLHLGIFEDKIKQEGRGLYDAVEVIFWYQHQIYVKLIRALEGDLENEGAPSVDIPRAADGSAKVALIGIDRSIGAWCRLMKQFHEQEGAILDILVILERIRKSTEKVFPNARAFVRPGFHE